MNRKQIKIRIIILLGLLLITTGTAWLIMLPPKVDNSGYTLIENLKIPVYSDIKVKDLITSVGGKVITNKTINTEKLGEQDISFIYTNKGLLACAHFVRARQFFSTSKN